MTPEEKSTVLALKDRIYELLEGSLSDADRQAVDERVAMAVDGDGRRDVFGMPVVLRALQTALVTIEEMSQGASCLMAVLEWRLEDKSQAPDTADRSHHHSLEEKDTKASGAHGDGDRNGAKGQGDDDVALLLRGLHRIGNLYDRGAVLESENFRNLLLSFAEDLRVVLIMIADRLNLLRQLRDTELEDKRREAAAEANYLYAPLAHKMGLYRVKSEIEDLYLKYVEHDAYYMIREKLSATKKSRDMYIEQFIEPVKKRLEESGLKFHIKGRTKSIHSIWEKMKRQKCGFEGIYDLFAIRVIIDAPEEKEKMQCWQAYSIVTDMYMPNPKRLRDWLSMPKSNGYESLHITVLGPENKWVEVQIRTERMDEVAEKGLAAHWRYKGVKASTGLDQWLANIREALEANDDLQLMDQFRLGLYDDEVYVFTPKGDLLKFPKGATVLDFAYHIHSKVGDKCVGARIAGRIVSIRERLNSGDQIEVLTQANQKPKRDWLNIVTTSRAKAKIRLSLKETQTKEAQLAKETLMRKFKNRKIEPEEKLIAQLINKLGYKEASEFYKSIAEGKTDTNQVVDKYVELKNHDQGNAPVPVRSAGEFLFENPDAAITQQQEDVLVIDQNLKGIDFTLAKCCQPIYGDRIFGFVTSGGGIKIHRTDCPNARELRSRFGYRIVKAKWSGKGTSMYASTIRVVGTDDLGIVNNITNIISKEERIVMRGINIDSHDGLFSGSIVVQLDDTNRLDSLIKKLKTVRGVRQVTRE